MADLVIKGFCITGIKRTTTFLNKLDKLRKEHGEDFCYNWSEED